MINNAVSRIIKTKTQANNIRVQRWKNRESTFEITDPQKISGKHILLVDDAITTGAGLEACGFIILEISGIRLSNACTAPTV